MAIFDSFELDEEIDDQEFINIIVEGTQKLGDVQISKRRKAIKKC
jgi:hypothetical protein